MVLTLGEVIDHQACSLDLLGPFLGVSKIIPGRGHILGLLSFKGDTRSYHYGSHCYVAIRGTSS